MAIIRRIREAISGKSDIERKQEKVATAQIRKEVMSAQLRERREQAVKYAVEAEKLKYQRKLNQLKNPKPKVGGSSFGLQTNTNDLFGFRNYGSVSGQTRIINKRTITKPIGNKSIRRKKKIRKRFRQPVQSQQPERINILGI